MIKNVLIVISLEVVAYRNPFEVIPEKMILSHSESSHMAEATLGV